MRPAAGLDGPIRDTTTASVADGREDRVPIREHMAEPDDAPAEE